MLVCWRERDRDRDRQTDRDRARETETEIQGQRQRQRLRERERDRQRQRHTEAQTRTQTLTDRQTETEIRRQRQGRRVWGGGCKLFSLKRLNNLLCICNSELACTSNKHCPSQLAIDVSQPTLLLSTQRNLLSKVFCGNVKQAKKEDGAELSLIDEHRSGGCCNW